MKKPRFTEEQILYVLRQAECGTPPADVCRQLGVSKGFICGRIDTAKAAPRSARWGTACGNNARLKRLARTIREHA